MSKLSISRAWDETRDILRRDGRLLMTLAAALFLLPQVIAGVIDGQAQAGDQQPFSLPMIVAALIALVGQLAVAWLAYGSRGTVGESIQHALRRALPFVGALLLVLLIFVVTLIVAAAILAAAGVIRLSTDAVSPRDASLVLILALLPMLYLSVRLLPSVAVASVEKVGSIGILKRSWGLTAGHFGRLFGFLVLFLIAAMVFAVALGLLGGLLVQVAFGDTGPFTMGALVLALINGILQAVLVLVYVLMLTRIYVQLSGASVAEKSVPHSGA